jgi:N-methylhydantoinase A
VLIDTESEEVEARLEAVLKELEDHARSAMLEEGASADLLTTDRWVDARYRGQSFELAVEADGWVEAFHRAHLERYGYERREAAVEAVTLRAVVSAPTQIPGVPELPTATAPVATEPSEVIHEGAALTASRVWRQDLRAGHELAGPAIVQEYSATTWVPPDWKLSVDRTGSLHLVDESVGAGRS